MLCRDSPFSLFRGNIEKTYIRLLSCLGSLIKHIQWLTKVKRPFLSATISSKDYLRLAFRHAPISYFLFLHDSHLTFSRYSVFPETSIWVSPLFLILCSRGYIDGRSGFLVGPATISYMRFSPDVITGSRRRPPEDRLDWQLVLALLIYRRTNRVDPHPVTN